jgi:outer membrane protein assembly factor BamB
VVDTATATVYVVAFVEPGRHDLVAINLSDGSIRWRLPADPPGLDPFHEQQRAAPTIANGRVYVAYGGLFGDCGPYKGAVVSLPLDGAAQPQSWIVPTTREGGIWAPSGPAVDSTGDLFVSIGNAASTDPKNFDDGNAVVRLHPDLSGAPIIAGSSVGLISNSGRPYTLDATTGTVQSDTYLHTSVPGFPTPTVLPGAVLVPANDRLIAFMG